MAQHEQIDMSNQPSQGKKTIKDSEIQNAFAGSTVFLTGGTGFLGKLLIEKLLRCCPKIKKLYVLIRPKKSKEAMLRLREQLEDVIYDRLKKETSDFMEKICIVQGDVSQIELGMSTEDRERIKTEVEFIFHGAATVRFDETLKKAVDINVRGPREILGLARECGKLRACVHISTAYSNCALSDIDEMFYECNIPGDNLIDLVATTHENTLKNITPGLLGELPNTYVYTKLAGEDIVRKHSQGLPVAVVRPAIVITTAKEPIPGWIDNVYGATGMVAGAYVGLIHVIYSDAQVKPDLVPADFVVNAIITAAWKTSKDFSNMDQTVKNNKLPTVYNYVSSDENSITWGKFMRKLEAHGYKYNTTKAIWIYFLYLVKNEFLYCCSFFFLHLLPAYIVDSVAALFGKKPGLTQAYKKIGKFLDVMKYFGIREWHFRNGNVRRLLQELEGEDRVMFEFDMDTLDWENFFTHYMKGVRVYLLKDPLHTVPEGNKKYLILKCVHYAIVTVLGYGILRLLWFSFTLFYYCIH